MNEIRRTVIPLEIIDLDDNGVHLLIVAKIGRRAKINLLIDTGASKSVFDSELFADYVNDISDEDEIKSTGIGSGEITSKKANLYNLTVGKFKFDDYELVLMDLSHINKMYSNFTDKKIWGLLGGDFLAKHNSIINYKSKSLIIFNETSIKS